MCNQFIWNIYLRQFQAKTGGKRYICNDCLERVLSQPKVEIEVNRTIKEMMARQW